MAKDIKTGLGGSPEAAARLADKVIVASPENVRTAQWEEVPLALRERAFFSASVESVKLLSEMKRTLEARVAGERQNLANGNQVGIDRGGFIRDMRTIQAGLGMPLTDQPGGSLTDISSAKRLGLVYDHNVRQAGEYARWTNGQDPAVLDEFPAQELVREEPREKPRDWQTRWLSAGGRIYGGRMIALKSDPVWEAISRFGTPYPPFDFGSGMGIQDVDRTEAEALGLIRPDEPAEPRTEGFNDRLEASAQNLDPDMLQTLKEQFGDQIDIPAKRGPQSVTWKELKLEQMAEVAKTAGNLQMKVTLGVASPKAMDMIEAAGFDRKQFSAPENFLTVPVNRLAHIDSGHGAGHEIQKDQVPLEPKDFRWMTQAWRDPDSAVKSTLQADLPSVTMTKATPRGLLHIVIGKGDKGQKSWHVITAWMKANEKKKGG
jgi:hypothetical protein